MDLKPFFHPKSIAVVGVSRERKKLGSVIFHNLLAGGFPGRLIPVHPTLTTFVGRRAFPDVTRITGRVDLVVIATPAATVPQIVLECGKAGIRNIVIISAGFRESGREGQEREAALRRSIKKYRLNLLGPNCLGVLHGDAHLNASFSQGLAPGGSVALISQSGAMAVAMSDWARAAKLPFRALVSLGNKAGLSEIDFLEHFGRDTKTKAILLYMESCDQGQAFLRALRQAVKKKPVVVLKAGESERGQQAAASHTGALASSSRVFAAAVAQTGAVLVDHIEALFDTALLLSTVRAVRGPRVAVITNAGGPGIMTTDAIAASSLSLSVLQTKTVQRLRGFLPTAASTANPIDLVGDADVVRYRRALSAVASDANVDAIIVILTPQVVTDANAIAAALVRFHKQFPHKVILSSFLGERSVHDARNRLRRAGMPHFSFPEEAVAALDKLSQMRPRQSVISHPPASARPPGTGILPSAALRLLHRHGFAIVPSRLMQNAKDADATARRLGYPVALKIMRHDVIHKAHEHALWLDLSGPAELKKAFRESGKRFKNFRPQARDEGWLLQPMVYGGAEWFVGAKRDPAFGIVILLGHGGIDVEQRDDLILLFPPFAGKVLERSLQRLHPQPSSFTLRQLAEAARKLFALMRSEDQLQEFDINPLLIDEKKRRCLVIDARARERS